MREAAQLKAAAALANLSTDRFGQEAMVTEHELVIPGLFSMLQVSAQTMTGAQAWGRLTCAHLPAPPTLVIPPSTPQVAPVAALRLSSFPSTSPKRPTLMFPRMLHSASR
jgi:hypothetical protein